MRSRVSFLAVLVLLGPALAAAAARAEEKASPQTGESREQARPPAPPAADEIAALRREIEELKRQIQVLREQLRAGLLPDQETAAEAPPPVPVPPAPPAAALPPAPARPGLPAGAGAGGAAPTRVQSLLNPAISAILLAAGTTSLKREADANGFDLSEAEIAFQSAVDPFTRVDLFLSFPAGETPEVEEGFISTLALPGPLQLKGGRFKGAFGKWNGLHTHQFFSVDRPNVLANFFGEESLTTDGLSLSVLVPNPWDQYIDLLTEVGTALEGSSFNNDRRNLTFLEHLTWFFNTGPNSTLELGLSAVRGRAGPPDTLLQALQDCVLCAGAGLAPRGELESAVNGVDLTYKWKPVRLNVYRSVLWQTEALRSRRHVDVLLDPAGTPSLDPAIVEASGGYSHLEWQFAKRWRVGARYDWSGFPDEEAARERAISGLIRFQPSEFQEIRLQYKRTRRNDEAALRFDGEPEDSQLFFQWIPVIGAHGAHKY